MMSRSVCLTLALALAVAGGNQAAAQSSAATARTGPDPVSGSKPAQSQIRVFGATRDGANRPVPGAKVRLRNARTGLISADTVADAQGEFVFQSIEPGMYVVEMMDAQGQVIAAGELLTVDVGQTVATIVKMTVRVAASGWFSDAAGAIASAAASAGVLGVGAVVGPVSPER